MKQVSVVAENNHACSYLVLLYHYLIVSQYFLIFVKKNHPGQ